MKDYNNRLAAAALAALLATAGCATGKGPSIDSKTGILPGYARTITKPYGEFTLRAPNGRNIGAEIRYDPKENYSK